MRVGSAGIFSFLSHAMSLGKGISLHFSIAGQVAKTNIVEGKDPQLWLFV